VVAVVVASLLAVMVNVDETLPPPQTQLPADVGKHDRCATDDRDQLRMTFRSSMFRFACAHIDKTHFECAGGRGFIHKFIISVDRINQS
jgi:hypothetical protein